jgi:hypothetical protein
LKLPRHGQRRTLDGHLAELVASPLAPEKGVEVPVSKPVDGGGELTLKREAAHLSVRDDVEPGLCLQGERLVYGRVLHLRESFLGDLARVELLPGFEQEGRAQQAADDVGAGHKHAPTLEPCRYDSRFAPRRGSRA